MIAEQLIADIQKLIKRGAISPSAEVEINVKILDGFEKFRFDDCTDIEIENYESSYNKLVLIAK